MPSRRVLQLRRQKEIIEFWLHTPGIPTDACLKLADMLEEVNKELELLVFRPSIQRRPRNHPMRPWRRTAPQTQGRVKHTNTQLANVQCQRRSG